MSRSPFPLQWPDGWKRTSPGFRQRSQFGPHFTLDRDAVIRWLEKREMYPYHREDGSCGCEHEPHTCDLDEDERAELIEEAAS